MKGQVSVFIIIGVLVLIAFGTTFYVGGKVRRDIEKKPSEQRVEQLGIEPIVDAVKTCLSLSALEALAILGSQGGVIYKSQGGVSPNPPVGDSSFVLASADGKSGVVPFLIVPPVGSVGALFFSDAPKYPFESFPYIPGEDRKLFTGYYGVSSLSPLYKQTPDGQNVSFSIQETLESFIAKRVVDCASWESFEAKNYNVVSGEASVSLIFAEKLEQFENEQNLAVSLNWPLDVSSPSKDRRVLSDFSVKVPVRLAAVYYTVKKILDGDVTDISFSPSSSGSFTVEKKGFEGYSVLSVSDEQSVVSNKPFEFKIFRKNRIPALWLIDAAPLAKVHFHITPEGRGAKITVERNVLKIDDPCQDADVPNPFMIELNASDPDEDEVSFVVDTRSADGEIPKDSVGKEYSITVFADDGSTVQKEKLDYQVLPINVAMCEVR